MANKKLGIVAELPPFRHINMDRLSYIVDCSQDIYASDSESMNGVMFLVDDTSMVIATRDNGYIGFKSADMKRVLKEALEFVEVMR